MDTAPVGLTPIDTKVTEVDGEKYIAVSSVIEVVEGLRWQTLNQPLGMPVDQELAAEYGKLRDYFATV